MRYRCQKVTSSDYINYGARGITVCNDWSEYLSFYNWAVSNGYSENLTIDRINNDGNYEPCNCRWVTLSQQNRNYRKNIFYSYGGETKCLKDWSNELGLKYNTVYMKIKRGKSIQEALGL